MKRYFVCFLFATLLAVFKLHGQSTDTVKVKKVISELTLKAEEALYDQNFRSAIAHFSKLVELDTLQKHYYLYQLGIAYSYSNIDNTKTIDCFEKSEEGIDMEAFGAGFYFAYGKACQSMYQFDKAIELYNKCLSYKRQVNDDSKVIVNKQIESCKIAKKLTENPSEIRIENMLTPVNTTWDEYRPVITNDESVLIFTSRRPDGIGKEQDKSGNYYEDIFITERNPLGNWSVPKSISANINTDAHDASIGLDEYGNTLYLYKNVDGNQGIYVSTRNKNEWSIPVEVEGGVNSKFWESSNYVTPDGKRMFFSSTRKEGSGAKDLYYSDLKSSGIWGDPINLGTVINTAGDEDSPFFDVSSGYLYFSSNGLPTMGGYDIFRSKFENGQFSPPENLGTPVNTPLDDIHFKLSANGMRAYYATVRENGLGKLDIYSVILKELTIKHSIIRGKILLDDKKIAPETIKLIVRDQTSENILPYIFSPDKNGNYLFFLPPNQTYSVLVDVPNRNKFQFQFNAPYTSEVHIKRNLPFFNQLIYIKDFSPFGVKTGDAITVTNSFQIPNEIIAYPQDVAPLNRDYFKILYEILLTSADSVIKDNVGSSILKTNKEVKKANQSINLPAFPLADRRNQFTLITDPEINYLSPIFKDNRYSKTWYAIRLSDSKNAKEQRYGDDNYLVAAQKFIHTDYYDISGVEDQSNTLINKLVIDYFRELKSSDFEFENTEVLVQLIVDEFKDQNKQLSKAFSTAEITEKLSKNLSYYLYDIYETMVYERLSGYDSLQLSAFIDVKSLGLSNDEISDILSKSLEKSDSSTVSKKLDIYLAYYFGALEKSASNAGISFSKEENLSKQIDKQISFIIKLQLLNYNRGKLYKEKVKSLVKDEILNRLSASFKNYSLTDLAKLSENKAVEAFKKTNDTSLVSFILNHPIGKISGVSKREVISLVDEKVNTVINENLLAIKTLSLDEKLSERTRRQTKTFVKGRIIADNYSQADIIVIKKEADNKVFPQVVYEPDKFGNFVFSIESNSSYDLFVKTEGYQDYKFSFTTPETITPNDSLIDFRYLVFNLNTLDAFENKLGEIVELKSNINVRQTSSALSIEEKEKSNFTKKITDYTFYCLQSKTDSILSSESSRAGEKTLRYADVALKSEKEYLRDLQEFTGSDFYGCFHYYNDFQSQPSYSIVAIQNQETTTLNALGKQFRIRETSLNEKSPAYWKDMAILVEKTLKSVINSQSQVFSNQVKNKLAQNFFSYMSVNSDYNASDFELFVISELNKFIFQEKINPIQDDDYKSLVSIVLSQLDEHKRRKLAEHQLARLAHLKILNAIEVKLQTMSLEDINALDSLEIAKLIDQQVGIASLSDFPELKAEQIEILKKIDFKEFKNNEINKILSKEIQSIKINQIAKKAENSNEIVVCGTISSFSETNALTRLKFADNETGEIAPYALNPDANGNYLAVLEKGKNYNLVIETSHSSPQVVSVDLRNLQNLYRLPFIVQTLKLEHLEYDDNTIGNIVTAFNSSDVDANLFLQIIKADSLSLPILRDSIFRLKEQIKSLSNATYKSLNYESSYGEYGRYLASNFPDDKITKSATIIFDIAKRLTSSDSELFREIEKNTGISVISLETGNDDIKRQSVIIGKDTLSLVKSFYQRANEFNYSMLSRMMSDLVAINVNDNPEFMGKLQQFAMLNNLKELNMIKSELKRFELNEDDLSSKIIASALEELLLGQKELSDNTTLEKLIPILVTKLAKTSQLVVYTQKKEELVSDLVNTVSSYFYLNTLNKKLKQMPVELLAQMTESDWSDMIQSELTRVQQLEFLKGIESELKKLEVYDLEKLLVEELLTQSLKEKYADFFTKGAKLEVLKSIDNYLTQMDLKDNSELIILSETFSGNSAKDALKRPESVALQFEKNMTELKSFQVQKKEENSTENVLLVRGKLSFDKDLNVPFGVQTKIILLEASSGKKVAAVQQPDSKGNYLLVLDRTKKYDLIIQADGYVNERISLSFAEAVRSGADDYLVQEIYIQEIKSLDVAIGQQLAITQYSSIDKNNKLTTFNFNILEKYSNISLNQIVVDDETILVNPSNSIAEKFDYKKLSAMVVDLALQSSLDNTEMLEWFNRNKKFHFTELSEITNSVKLIEVMNDEDKILFASIIADALSKLNKNDSINTMSEVLKKDLIVKALNKSAASKIDVVTKDKNQARRNRVAYMLEAHSQEWIKKESIVSMFKEQAKLTVLDIMQSQLKAQSLVDLTKLSDEDIRKFILESAALDSIILARNMDGSVANNIVKSTIDSLLTTEYIDLKNKEIAVRSETLESEKFVLSGSIQYRDKKAASNGITLGIAEKLSGSLVHSDILPDTKGNYAVLLNKNKVYLLLIQQPNFQPQTVEINQGRLVETPFLFQQIELNTLFAVQNIIGQEMIITESDKLLNSKNSEIRKHIGMTLVNAKANNTNNLKDGNGNAIAAQPVQTTRYSDYKYTNLEYLVTNALTAIDLNMLESLSAEEIALVIEETLKSAMMPEKTLDKSSFITNVTRRSGEIYREKKTRIYQAKLAKEQSEQIISSSLSQLNPEELLALSEDKFLADFLENVEFKKLIDDKIINKESLLKEFRTQKERLITSSNYSSVKYEMESYSAPGDDISLLAKQEKVKSSEQNSAIRSLIAKQQQDDDQKRVTQQKRVLDSLQILEKERMALLTQITKANQEFDKRQQEVNKASMPSREDSLIVAEIRQNEKNKKEENELAQKLIRENEKLLAEALLNEERKLIASAKLTAKKTKHEKAVEEKLKPKKSNESEPTALKFDNVDFVLNYDLDAYFIMPEHYEALNSIVAQMTNNKSLYLLIEGHTDSSGSEVYNNYIASKRAATIKRKLVKMGCDEKRIGTKSKGENEPRYSNETREGREKNRRVEIYFSTNNR